MNDRDLMDWAQIHNATGVAAWWARLACQRSQGKWSTSRPFLERLLKKFS